MSTHLRRSPRLKAKAEAKAEVEALYEKSQGKCEEFGYKTAFFIDTNSRLGRFDTVENRVRTLLKVVLLFATLVLLFWLLFVDQDGKLQNVFASPRFCVSWIFAAVFVARVLIQMSFFWSRSIPWVEVLAEAGGIIPLSLSSLAYEAKKVGGEISTAALAAAILLFLAGTWLNLWSEFQRYAFKLDKRNKGKLFTGGLFGACRHINYFGEILSFVGYAVVAGTWLSFWVPVVMGIGMGVFSVPELEFYLEKKYAKSWQGYVKRTPCVMIPYIW